MFALRATLVLDHCVGAKFWFGLVGGVIAAGIAVAIIFWLIGAAVVAWGFFGAILAIAAVAIGFGWLYDRRQPSRYEEPV